MQNLQLELKSSRYLFLVLVVLHIGAMLCIVFASLSYQWKIIDFLLTSISLVAYYFRLQRWTNFSWHQKEGWKLANSTRTISVELKGDSIRTKWLIILNFRHEDFPYCHSLIIFPDTISRESFRRLQVVLFTQP